MSDSVDSLVCGGGVLSCLVVSCLLACLLVLVARDGGDHGSGTELGLGLVTGWLHQLLGWVLR